MKASRKRIALAIAARTTINYKQLPRLSLRRIPMSPSLSGVQRTKLLALQSLWSFLLGGPECVHSQKAMKT